MKILKAIFWFIIGFVGLVIAAIWLTDPDRKSHRRH